jgi:DNA-binding response OmpR family regulator
MDNGDRSIAMGANAFLVKPFRFSQLIASIQQVLDLDHPIAENSSSYDFAGKCGQSKHEI